MYGFGGTKGADAAPVSLNDVRTPSAALYSHGMSQFRVRWLLDLKMKGFAPNDVDRCLLSLLFSFSLYVLNGGNISAG